MPELPEVETARRGIAPHLIGRRLAGVSVRQRQLRWPVPAALVKALPGQTIRAVERRAKYILIRTDAGTVLLHLGMSGSLRVLPCRTPPQQAAVAAGRRASRAGPAAPRGRRPTTSISPAPTASACACAPRAASARVAQAQ